MANEIIKNGIIGALESLVEMTANVTETKGPIHQLDIDLLQDQIRKLYREVQLLNEANRQMLNAGIQMKPEPRTIQPEKPVEVMQEVIVEKPVEPVAEIPEPVIEPVAEIPVPVIEPVVEVPQEKPVEPVTLSQPVVEEKTVVIAEMQAEEVAEVVQNPVPETRNGDLFSQPLTIAEKLKKQDNSINQQMMGNNTVRNEKLTGSPIQNLKTAIGINDKFIFVNELFKGEMKEYEAVLGLINDAAGEETAMSILHENLQKRGTLDKAEIRMKLERFIQRRFAK